MWRAGLVLLLLTGCGKPDPIVSGGQSYTAANQAVRSGFQYRWGAISVKKPLVAATDANDVVYQSIRCGGLFASIRDRAEGSGLATEIAQSGYSKSRRRATVELSSIYEVETSIADTWYREKAWFFMRDYNELEMSHNVIRSDVNRCRELFIAEGSA